VSRTGFTPPERAMEMSISSSADPRSGAGTVRFPRFEQGHTDVCDDVKLHQRFFSFDSDSGTVVGSDLSVMFTLDRPASQVWPYFRDFNLWQNDAQTASGESAEARYYSAVLGDLYSREDLTLGAETFRVSVKPNDPGPHQQRLLRVIPERVIVLYQPIPDEGVVYYDGPHAQMGVGGVSPGFHTMLLNEHEGKTTVSIVMQHASRLQGESKEEALAYWREVSFPAIKMWRDNFIPKLKRLVYGED
jgi:hypothetical protein